MSISDSEIINFLSHITLLTAKVWVTYVVYKCFTFSKSAHGDKTMLIYNLPMVLLFFFGIFSVLFELYYLYGYYRQVYLYCYEYQALFTQIVFISISANYLKKV